jgi:hypothetical protein
MSFRLRFPASEIGLWAERFPVDVDQAVERLAPGIRKRGYLRRSEFLSLCAWKTPRTARRCASNSSALIIDATRLALRTGDERAKIGILRLLAGVDWPTASVLLHFSDRRPYPILDTRALWSLGVVVNGRYDFDFWRRYTLFLRGLARSTGYSMRTVDRALWQYSKERQRTRRF